MSLWSNSFDSENQPTQSQTKEFISSPLWEELNNFLTDSYKISSQPFYSVCSAQTGWNYKYKLKGKALCTLYPEKGFFIALIVISEKEDFAVTAILPLLSDYTKNLFNKTPSMKRMGKWLMLSVNNMQVLEDIKLLITVKLDVKK